MSRALLLIQDTLGSPMVADPGPPLSILGRLWVLDQINGQADPVFSCERGGGGRTNWNSLECYSSRPAIEVLQDFRGRLESLEWIPGGYTEDYDKVEHRFLYYSNPASRVLCSTSKDDPSHSFSARGRLIFFDDFSGNIKITNACISKMAGLTNSTVTRFKMHESHSKTRRGPTTMLRNRYERSKV